jgi:hypothetical protein
MSYGNAFGWEEKSIPACWRKKGKILMTTVDQKRNITPGLISPWLLILNTSSMFLLVCP